MLHTKPGEPKWNKNTVLPEKSGEYQVVYRINGAHIISKVARFDKLTKSFIVDGISTGINLSNILLWR